jgi:hypothetical protein
MTCQRCCNGDSRQFIDTAVLALTQPSMHKVHHVCSHVVVHASQDLSKVKRSRKGSTSPVEPVHIVTSVVGHNRQESVCICQKLGQEQILDGIPVQRCTITKMLPQRQVG